MQLNKVYNEDCLIGMQRIPDKSVDMILCDLPYGTTACKWDTIIPFEPLWKEYNRIIKDSSVVVLTTSQPFTTDVVNSNRPLFRYEWIWKKDQGRNFQLAKKQPLKITESICIFYKALPLYNPQGLIKLEKPIVKSNAKKSGSLGHISGLKKNSYEQHFINYPTNLIQVNSERGLHPTQKPVALFEYLIKTYTNEGDLVLDNCMGSGTTAIACINTKRNYIGFEKDEKYFQIIQERILKHTDTELHEMIYN